MNGVSSITSEQDRMLITLTGADSSAALRDVLTAFAESGIVVDMICQTAPRGIVIDFSFTTEYRYFDAAMKVLSNVQNGAAAPLISSGYSKLNLFGEDMVTSCGVAAAALQALADAQIEVVLITTSDLDISLLVRAEHEDSALLALCNKFDL